MCISVNKLDDEIDIFHDSITALNRVSHRQQLLLVITSLAIVILSYFFALVFHLLRLSRLVCIKCAKICI